MSDFLWFMNYFCSCYCLLVCFFALTSMDYVKDWLSIVLTPGWVLYGKIGMVLDDAGRTNG